MNNVVINPYEYFADPTKGRPIFNGSIFIGEPDTDPEVPANQKQVYARQENGTEVAIPQPVDTNAGGYPTYNGSVIAIVVNGSYSIKVNDKNGVQAFYSAFIDGSNFVAQVSTIAALRLLEPAFDGQQCELLGHTVAGIGGGVFYSDYSSVAPDDNGVTVVTAGGKRWSRKNKSASVEHFGPDITGVTSSDSAFLSAQAFAAGAPCYVPSGNYLLSGTYTGDFYSDGAVSVSASVSINIRRSMPKLSQRFAPSLPTIGTQNKLIMVPASSLGEFFVVTKKANGKNGFIAIQIDKLASPVDADNTGGDSNYRAQQVYDLTRCFVGKTAYETKTSGVNLSALAASQINTMWEYSAGGGADFVYSYYGTIPYSWNSRDLWNLSTSGEEIVYKVNTGNKTNIRFGMTNGSSTSVTIKTSANGTNWIDYQTISLAQGPSGAISSRVVPVVFNSTNPWYIKIVNNVAASCYVAGLNIGSLYEYIDGEFDIDNALTVSAPDVGGAPSPYQGGGGANEFAARPTDGKWFGTYHGGHSGFLERFRVNLAGSTASYDIRTALPQPLILTRYAHLHSYSLLTVGTSVYEFSAETALGDGAYVCSYSLELTSGNPVLCQNIYTHMCTAQRNFNWVHLPKNINKEDDGVLPIGQCSFIQQYRSADGAHINCYFSEVDTSENAYDGARIDFSTSYNKQYYGPAVSSSYGVRLTAGQWITAKEYF